jgi:hypothetical protein
LTVAEYSVRTENLDEVAEALARYPEIASEEIQTTMMTVVIGVANRVGEHTPVFMNRLKPAILASPKVEIVGGEARGIVDAGGVPYALDMEIGPPAGRWPNMGALRRWAHLVLGDESAAGAVARRLFEGTSRVQRRPYAMFARGWVDAKGWVSRQFEVMLKRIVERMAGGG